MAAIVLMPGEVLEVTFFEFGSRSDIEHGIMESPRLVIGYESNPRSISVATNDPDSTNRKGTIWYTEIDEPPAEDEWS